MKVGLIGLGVMGKNHYRILKNIPEVKLTAVCDSFFTEGLPERCYTDVDEMLNQEKLDAVIVSVPTSLHLEIASKVLKCKIPVLIEKPIAPTIEEAKKIIEIAESNQIPAVLGHVERFNPVVRSLMKELVEKEILSIDITRIGPFPPRIKDAGVIVDLSVHDIDLVSCLTHDKKPTDINIYKSEKRFGGYEDNAVIIMKFEDEIIANITTNWLTPFKKRTIEVATESEYYVADLMAQELTVFSEYTENNSYLTRNCFVKKGEPLLKELKSFFHFVESGERDGLASLEDGLKVLKTIYRGLK